MKKSFLILVGILVIGAIIATTGCTEIGDKSLIVRIDDKIIESKRLEKPDIKEIFKDSFKREDLNNSEFVDLGRKVYLDFGVNKPDKVVVHDSILSPDGKFMFNDQATSVFTCGRDEDGFYFVVEKHPASALSSVIEIGGKDMRGHIIRASWGDKDVIFGFVINTDSAF